MKFEKIRDIYDDTINGYKYGDYYLMKHYFFNNQFSWIIAKTDKLYYTTYEYNKLYDAGEIIPVCNYKEGKKMIIAMQEA